MKEQAQISSENTVLRVGYASPGWPLRHFPSGIVAYIQNILDGFDDNIKPIILADAIGSDTDVDLIDTSSLTISRSLLQKLLDEILYKIKLPYIQSIQYKRNTAYMLQNLSLAIQQLREPLDILEIEETFGVAGFLLKTTKVPIVTRLHGPWFIIGPYAKTQEDTDFKLRVFYEGEAIKNSHGVTAPSLDVLEKVREYYGIALPDAKVIPNPVPEVSTDKQWRYDANKTPSILFVGRFDSVKGGDLILEAFRLIALRNKEVELLFVGPDNGVDVKGKSVKFNEYIERFIPEESVKKRIQFLGHCDQHRISELRKNSLVTIVCSRYEVFSISLAEALAAGCPTIATAVGGIKEIIVNEYNGLFADPESPESIAEKVLGLIDSPEKMQLLSKNAIEDCKRRFSPKVVAQQTVDYYRSVLTRSLQ